MRRIAIPPMLGDLIVTTLLAVDGVSFADLPGCPTCGGAVRRHDRKRRRFARVRDGESTRDVHVTVSRFTCDSCGGFWYARQPFYTGVRFGIPVVDLALALSRAHPYHRAERVLAALGILVDRGTIRTYTLRAQRPVPATDLLGIPLPISLLNLSTLVTRRPKGSPVTGAEVLAALGFPPAHRAPQHLPFSPEEGQEGEEEEEEETRKTGKEEGQGNHE